MNILSKLFTSGAGELIEKIGNTADKFITTKAEKEQLKQEMTNIVQDHELKMSELAQKELESHLKDNQDARNREIQIAISEKAPKINKIITPVLALVVLGLTFGMYYGVLFKGLGADNKEIVFTILGSLSTMSAGVIGYYFGSSAGSSQKQQTIDKLMNK